MKIEDYLVTTHTDEKTPRKFIWKSSEKAPLDHPVRWMIEKANDGGVQLRRLGPDLKQTDSAVFPVSSDLIQRGGRLKIRSNLAGKTEKTMFVRIQKLNPIRPAYVAEKQAQGSANAKRSAQLFLFWGTRYFMIGFKALGSRFEAEVGPQKIFTLVKKEKGYFLTAFVRGVKFKYPGKARKEFPVNTPFLVSEEVVTTGGIQWEKHWWRVNRVPTPDPLPIDEIEKKEAKEAKSFQRMALWVLGFFILFAVIVKLAPIPDAQKERIIEQTQITLKQPKIIAPEPVKEAKKEKPKPKPPEPAKAKPKPKVEKTPPPKAQQKPVVKPPPPPPPTVFQPPVEVKPDPAAEKAKAQAQVAKSLNFLSPSTKSTVANIKNEKVNSKYNTVGNVDDPKKANASVLSNIATSKQIEGPIETKNARNVKSDVVIKGKALNDIQGKVALAELYDPNAKGNMGASISGKGMQLSGAGQISESEIEKALAKYLSKFQYCYEKALLSDSSLAGTILIQWTISLKGEASDTKIIRSQLKNEGLHQCLTKEIIKIPFPIPKGGDVTIKYPFAFSSSSL